MYKEGMMILLTEEEILAVVPDIEIDTNARKIAKAQIKKARDSADSYHQSSSFFDKDFKKPKYKKGRFVFILDEVEG